MRIQIHKDGKLIVDVTLPDDKVNYEILREIVDKNNFRPVSGILLDLGMSSWQLETSGKGFSFQRDEFLDMRYDESQLLTAKIISLSVHPYFFINSSGSPDSPNVSLIPTISIFVGKLFANTSATALPNPQLI